RHRAEKPREGRLALLHEQRTSLTVDQVRCEANDPLVVRPHAVQDISEDADHLPELRTEIAFADHSGAAGNGNLPSDEGERATLHESDMRIEPLRRPGARRIFVPNFRHIPSWCHAASGARRNGRDSLLPASARASVFPDAINTRCR